MVRRPLLLEDSSSLIALDRRGRLSALDGFSVVIPPGVRTELVEDALAVSPESPAYPEAVASAGRFLYRVERGSIHVLDLDFVRYGRTLDRARSRLAKLEGTREDRTPKADAEMAAAAAQLVDEGRPFQVLCDDATLVDEVLRRILPNVSYITSADLAP